jgi:hypothetical protein
MYMAFLHHTSVAVEMSAGREGMNFVLPLASVDGILRKLAPLALQKTLALLGMQGSSCSMRGPR